MSVSRATRFLAPALLVPSLLASAPLAMAGTSIDRAKVIGVEPVYRSVVVSVPTEQCRLVDVPLRDEFERPRRSFTAPIVGAILGGAIGNAVGHGKTNKKVGTAVGAILGGSIGNDIGRNIARQNQQRYASRSVEWETREVCETVHETEERLELDGYDVTYRYAGELHTTRMDRDPGRYLEVRVRVTPV